MRVGNVRVHVPDFRPQPGILQEHRGNIPQRIAFLDHITLGRAWCRNDGSRFGALFHDRGRLRCRSVCAGTATQRQGKSQHTEPRGLKTAIMPIIHGLGGRVVLRCEELGTWLMQRFHSSGSPRLGARNGPGVSLSGLKIRRHLANVSIMNKTLAAFCRKYTN